MHAKEDLQAKENSRVRGRQKNEDEEDKLMNEEEEE